MRVNYWCEKKGHKKALVEWHDPVLIRRKRLYGTSVSVNNIETLTEHAEHSKCETNLTN